MMVGQYEELSCPFCKKGRISRLHIPSTKSFMNERSATFGSKTKVSKTTDIWLIKTGCNLCGKSSDEVEKELKRQNLI
jgi:hypothetical protein